jgi:hypothetical protein
MQEKRTITEPGVLSYTRDELSVTLSFTDGSATD